MATLTLDTTRIKSIRKARKIGRPKLAKLTGLTERQVTKLETTAPATAVDHATALRLSLALDVPLPTLTGEFEISEEDLTQAAPKSCGCCN
ncbi:MAG: helix-turn-helix transcriptional regulator [Pseudomonadota bacterium]